MLRRLLLLIVLVSIYNGCSDDTITPGGGVFGTDLSFSRSSTPSLTGGGRFFDRKDTGVWYDANFSYSVKNTSTSDHTFTYRLEFGLFKDGHYQQGGGAVAYNMDSIYKGEVASTIYNKTTGTVAIKETVGLGKRDNNWSVPYGYKLTIFDKQSGDSTSFEGLFDGSTADNRFHGIIYTTPQSPDSLGVFDAPDDGDWHSKNSDIVIAKPVRPNPASNLCTVSFDVQEAATVELSLRRTATDSLLTYNTGLLTPGSHTMDLNISAFVSGMYRLYIKGSTGSATSESHGDILITN